MDRRTGGHTASTSARDPGWAAFDGPEPWGADVPGLPGQLLEQPSNSKGRDEAGHAQLPSLLTWHPASNLSRKSLRDASASFCRAPDPGGANEVQVCSTPDPRRWSGSEDAHSFEGQLVDMIGGQPDVQPNRGSDMARRGGDNWF